MIVKDAYVSRELTAVPPYELLRLSLWHFTKYANKTRNDTNILNLMLTVSLAKGL